MKYKYIKDNVINKRLFLLCILIISTYCIGMEIQELPSNALICGVRSSDCPRGIKVIFEKKEAADYYQVRYLYERTNPKDQHRDTYKLSEKQVKTIDDFLKKNFPYVEIYQYDKIQEKNVTFVITNNKVNSEESTKSSHPTVTVDNKDAKGFFTLKNISGGIAGFLVIYLFYRMIKK